MRKGGKDGPTKEVVLGRLKSKERGDNLRGLRGLAEVAPTHGTRLATCVAAASQVHFTKKYMKMNMFFLYFVILCLVPFGSGVDYRGLFGNWFGGGVQSPCTGCPFRNCLNDRSVILGYCCGCARVSDFLPIDCPGLHLNCPSDGRRLCRDYDYMLNCCCP